MHGSYGPRGIQLEYDILQAINDEVGIEVRLVLHGTDPFTEEIFNKCIGHGVSKIYTNKVLNSPCVKVWQEEAGKAPLTAVIEEGATREMQKAVEGY